MRRTRSSSGAFTLIELLIVIAVIGVLIGLLLPALGRSREQARQVVCASNVRQVTLAFLAYAADNRGLCPGPSVVRPLVQDWIYWQPGRRLDDGRLVRYFGRFFGGSILRCPSDDLYRAQNNMPFFNKTYDYSYSANQYIIGPWAPPVKLSQIRNSSTMILIVEESQRTIDDGTWYPPMNQFGARHARPKPDRSGLGNAGFVDGHVESVTFDFANDPAHYKPQTGQLAGAMLVLPGGPLPPPNYPISPGEPPPTGGAGPGHGTGGD